MVAEIATRCNYNPPENRVLILRVTMPDAWSSDCPTDGSLAATAVSKCGKSFTLPVTEKLAKRMGGNRNQLFFAKERDSLPPKLDKFAPYHTWAE